MQKPSLVPQAHLAPQAPRETKVPQAPEDTKASKASRGSWPQMRALLDSTYRGHQAHLVHRDPKVTKVILGFSVVPLEGAHRAPCIHLAHLAHQDPQGLRGPSEAPAWRSSSTSRSTCRVTASGPIFLEFRAPRAHLVPQGLSPPSQAGLLTTQSWPGTL